MNTSAIKSLAFTHAHEDKGLSGELGPSFSQEHPRSDLAKKPTPELEKHTILAFRKQITTASEDHPMTAYDSDSDHSFTDYEPESEDDSITDTDSDSESHSENTLLTAGFESQHQGRDRYAVRLQAIVFEQLIEHLDPTNFNVESKLGKKFWCDSIFISADWAIVLMEFEVVEKIIPVYDDWMSVLSFQSRILHDFDLIKTSQDTNQVPNVRELSIFARENMTKIDILVKLRLLKLGGCDSEVIYWEQIKLLLPQLQLPSSVTGRTLGPEIERKLEDVAALLLDGVKKLMAKHEHIKWNNSESPWILPWKYSFKMVDLLSESGYIDDEKLRSFFQEAEMAKQVVFYSNAFLTRILVPRRFPDDKAWMLMNKSFKALDDNTKQNIRVSFLRTQRQTFIQKPSGIQTSDEEYKKRIMAFVKHKMVRDSGSGRSHRKKAGLIGFQRFQETLSNRILKRIKRDFSERERGFGEEPITDEKMLIHYILYSFPSTTASDSEEKRIFLQSIAFDNFIRHRIESIFTEEKRALQNELVPPEDLALQEEIGRQFKRTKIAPS
ncbi:hypothetical protein PSHT_02837 [Puccinia striiformis]|uniref:Uncharacterized protein n=1 Tax=Puccinia striiformis TaxID=27350 RepID=A0A2S4WH13_9BASI|nr:hypothetical protein PSHT_02837 [Puccinia striiformis]